MRDVMVYENFGGSPQNTMSDDLSDLWGSLGSKWNAVETAAGEVAAQTWGTVSSAPKAVWGAVKDAASGAVDAVDSTFSWFQGKILWVLAVVLGVIVILAKSGILSQSADVMRAFYGG